MKKLLLSMMLILCIITSVACHSENNSEIAYYTVYMANEEMNGLLPVETELVGESVVDKIDALLTFLQRGSDLALPTIPENIYIQDVKVDNNNVVITFNEDYNQLSPVDEIICRSSIVKSITQIDNLQTVEFYIGSVPLRHVNGNIVGAMNADDVVLDFDKTSCKEEKKQVTLYFADQDASMLVPVEKEIVLNNEEQIEKTVLDLLIGGPENKELNATIPKETKVKNVYINEGICYVDFSEEFVTKHMGGSTGEMLTIFSVVNTLTDLTNINKVQFLIEGTVREEYKGHYQFNIPFEKNWDVVKK